MVLTLLIKRRFRTILIFYTIFYISISHIVLPFFDVNNFLFFYNWNLFSVQGRENPSVYDLTWDNGDSFLYRDHRDKPEIIHRVNLKAIFSLLHSGNVEKIREEHLESLMEVCQCHEIESVKIRGTFYTYLLGKRKTEILERRPL